MKNLLLVSWHSYNVLYIATSYMCIHMLEGTCTEYYIILAFNVFGVSTQGSYSFLFFVVAYDM